MGRDYLKAPLTISKYLPVDFGNTAMILGDKSALVDDYFSNETSRSVDINKETKGELLINLSVLSERMCLEDGYYFNPRIAVDMVWGLRCAGMVHWGEHAKPILVTWLKGSVPAPIIFTLAPRCVVVIAPRVVEDVQTFDNRGKY